jgi:GTP-binding protein
VNSAIKTTTKTQVTLLLFDAPEGVTQQDKRLLDLLHERKTPFMVLVNKMDMVREQAVVKKAFRQALDFCPHVPLLFISALKKRGLEKILPLALQIHTECGIRIGTGLLNRAVQEVLDKHQPPVVKRLRAKFFYLTQAESNPPTFVFFVNDADRVPQSYARYLEKSLRSLFGIVHAPMRIRFRSSHKKK